VSRPASEARCAYVEMISGHVGSTRPRSSKPPPVLRAFRRRQRRAPPAIWVCPALASRPICACLDETVRDSLSFSPAARIRLRLQFADDHAYHMCRVHYVGIVRESRTAPVTRSCEAKLLTGDGNPGSPASRVMMSTG